jgi:hypothetical protein
MKIEQLALKAVSTCMKQKLLEQSSLECNDHGELERVQNAEQD